MSDKRINTAPDRESEDARNRLSEHALDPRSSSDRLARVSDGSDRATFRESCVEMLRGMRGDLRTASTEMSTVNKDVESGRLQPGSQEWKTRMEQAEAKYGVAIQNADQKLTPQLMAAIHQERTMLNDEMRLLQQAHEGRRNLSPEECRRLGVPASEAGNALKLLEQRKQQDMALEDLSRSAGYARANAGLALIRATVGLDEQSKQQQVQRGTAILAEAAQVDPLMAQDANFQKNARRIEQITGVRIGDAASVPGNGQVVQENGQTYIRDGNRRLFTGDNVVGSQNFRNPFEMLNALDTSLKNPDGSLRPMTKDMAMGYLNAIDAADKIDRVALQQKMRDEQGYIDRVLQTENGQRIKSILAVMDQKNQEMDRQQQQMATMIPDIIKGPDGQANPQAVAMLEKMRNFRTVEDLVGYLRDPNNQQEVNAFRALPKGNEFISTLEQFKNNQKIITQSEAEIAKYDPNFVRAMEELQKDRALYNSSEDARAHFLRALVRDQRNQTPENTALAQTMIKQLAEINPNIVQDPEFQQMATGLGMRPDAQGRLEVAQPGQQTGQSTITDATAASVRNAYVTFQQVQDNTPLTQEQHAAFQTAITEAAKINPQEVRTMLQTMEGELQRAGWTPQLEQQFNTLNQNVQTTFSQIDPAKQAQINEIQQKIGALPNDATAQQQRMNLEGQLNSMTGDMNVRAWLAARVDLANFYKNNGQAVQARMGFEEARMNLTALEHAAALTNGLYGAALLKSGDAQNARQYLIKGAADPVALQLAPEIQQAIQRTNDPTIMQEAQRAADQPAQPEQPAQVGGAQFDQAVAALGQSMEALNMVQANGQPLPENLRQVFQNAIDLNKNITAQQVEAMNQQMQQRLLAGWTPEMENQYKTLTQNVMTAERGVSQPAQQAIQQFAATLQPNDQQAGQKMEAKLQELAATDPTVKAYVDARVAAMQFYQTNPLAQNRDAYEQATMQLAQLKHGKGIAETMYAAALVSTGNPQDAVQAKELMTSALQDRELVQAFPQAAEIARAVGLGDQAAAPTDPELAKIPGFTQLQQAEQIMKDTTLTPQQRIERAGPLYAQAIEESKKINLGKLDQDLTAIGTKIKEIEAGAEAVQNDPAKLAQYQQEKAAEYQQLSADAEKLSNMRLQPMKARLLAAIAYNGAAQEMLAQADQDPAKKDELTRAAHGLNKQAADTLRSLETADPRMWRENPTIQGAIEQATKNQKIDPSAANVIGQVRNINQMVNFGVNGPVQGLQPLWMSMNAAGEGLQTVGKIPVIGFIPGALGAGLSRSEEVRPQAAMALAMAKNKDAAAANAAVDDVRQHVKNQMTYVVSDIASSYAGIYAGKFAVNALGSRLGPVGKVLTFAGVGLGTTVGTNKALDWSASQVIGTDMRDNAELMTRSAATFGMTWGLHGLSNYRNAANANFLNGEAARPSFAQSMKIWEPGAGLGNVSRTTNTALFEGAETSVSPALSRNFQALTSEGQAGIRQHLLNKGFTPETFSRLAADRQYSAFLAAETASTRATAAELAGGSKFMSRLPFSGNNAAAHNILGQAERPWMYSTKGNLAWRFGTGAGSMALYGVGEVNPLLTNKQTGENYTVGDMFKHAGTNAAWGGTASVALPWVGKALDFTVKKPLEFTMARPAAWLFNAEATNVARPWAGLAQAESKTLSQIGSSFTGNWAIAGENAVAAAGKRFGFGFAGGGGLGMLTHNPWMTNPETGKNYTWGESMGYGVKWGAIGGTGAVAAPYALAGARVGIEKVGKPLYNYTIVPAVNHGVAPVWNRMQPGVATVRSTLGTASDKVIQHPSMVSAYERLTNSAAAGRAGDAWRHYAAVSLVPTALIEGRAAGDGYAYYEWGRINKEADAILAAAKAEEEKTRQQQATQPVGPR